MKNVSLSLGYSGNIEELKKILIYSEHIHSLYTGGLNNKISGGRPQYIDKLSELHDQVKLIHEHGIDFEIALNAPCGFKDKSDKEWWSDIKNYIFSLEECGVDYIIASHPFLMKLVKDNTNMKVTVSTICEITNARSALYYEQMGADIIVPSMNVNYDMNALKTIASKLTKAKLRIMVNEHCLGDCPWRRFHHNHYAHSNNELDYHYNCKSLFLKNPHLMLTNNTIRPEDLKEYYSITNDFKIVGRLVPIDHLLMRIDAYSKESFDGNYIDLFDSHLSKEFEIDNKSLENLAKMKFACNKICEDCKYCMQLINT